jgi:hypothetical protein
MLHNLSHTETQIRLKLYYNEQDKPLILVTNDDGLSAPDSELYCCYGRDWEVSCGPDKPQSGMGHL